MDNQTLFSPDYKAINDVFGNDISYKIPVYQRPYSWECLGKSDKNNQVNIMWQDLMDYFVSQNPNPYFFGSMVLIGSSAGREFDVIDGQQRLTTYVLLFISIKCFLKKQENNIEISDEKKIDFISLINDVINEIDRLVFNRKRLGGITIEKKVKIESVFGFDYDNVLSYVMDCKLKEKFNFPENCSEENKIVSQRYFDNKDFFEEKLMETFLNSETKKLTESKFFELNNFLEFLKNKVVLVRIFASRFDVAYQVFEILNNRGLPLSNKDLFRNFLINEYYKLSQNEAYTNINPNQKWQELEINYNLDNDFISRFVESTNAKNQKYSAFNDLTEIYNKIENSLVKPKIEMFFEEIKTNLKYYSKIKNLDFDNFLLKTIIQFILKSGNVTYTINLLLSIFKNISEENKIIAFLQTFEKYVLFILIATNKRFNTSAIYKAIKYLNSKDYENAIKEFELKNSELEQLNNCMEMPIKDNDLAKLLIIKYVYINQLSKIADTTTEIQIKYEDTTLEHIIPQNPSNETNWKKDFTDSFIKEFTYKLGNMTILTQKLNASAKNFDFKTKQEIYKKTKLFITEEMTTNNFKISEQFLNERHTKITNELKKYFGLI